MERERGSRSISKCFLLCFLLFQNVGRKCELNSWPKPLFPGQLLGCFTASGRELPLWHGAQGVGATRSTASSHWGWAQSVIQPFLGRHLTCSCLGTPLPIEETCVCLQRVLTLQGVWDFSLDGNPKGALCC